MGVCLCVCEGMVVVGVVRMRGKAWCADVVVKSLRALVSLRVSYAGVQVHLLIYKKETPNSVSLFPFLTFKS